ncbi:MAG: hypothetical protein ACOYLB_10860 [Phototrophicaceae bacterium]
MTNPKPAPAPGHFILPTLMGVVFGGIIALLFAPTIDERQNAIEQVKEQIQNKLPPDPVQVSLAQGREAARRRKEELGQP